MSNNPFNNAQTFMGVGSVEADDLFGDIQEPEVKVDSSEKPEEKEEKFETIPEGNIEAEDLFGGNDDPESVGGDDDNKEEKEAKPAKSGPSPRGENLYSSFAQALKGDGLFQFLDDETVSGISDADSFSEAMDQNLLILH